MDVLTNLTVVIILQDIYQITTLYTLNLHKVAWPFFLNDNGKKDKIQVQKIKKKKKTCSYKHAKKRKRKSHDHINIYKQKKMEKI